MIRPVMVHATDLRVSGTLAMAADIATLLPEYRHILPVRGGLRTADTRIDMWLLSRGMDVVYGADVVGCACALLYLDGRVLLDSGGTRVDTGMANVPIVQRYARCRSHYRSFRKFRLGLLFGRTSGSLAAPFVSEMLRINESSGHPLKMVVTGPEDGRPVSEEDDPLSVSTCLFGPDMSEIMLTQCNVLAMPDYAVSDRVMVEAAASGIPVVTGKEAKTVTGEVLKFAGNREAYEKARREVSAEGSVRDMAYEIVKLKSQLRKCHQHGGFHFRN